MCLLNLIALSTILLVAELDKLLEDAPLPFIMQHAAKISAMRRRVSALNLILKSIQRRIDNMDRMLFAGVPTGIVCFPIYIFRRCFSTMSYSSSYILLIET